MGTEKRDRQKANSAAARQARIEAAQRAQNRARFMRLGIILAVGLVIVGVLAFLRRDTSTTVESAATTTTTAKALSPTAGSVLPSPTTCPPASGSTARYTTFAEPPPMCIDPAKTYTALVATTKGDFTIALDPKAAPQTVNSFVTLARYHFFDGVPFHRIIPGFVVQGGDPNGNPAGTGGPGYKIPDELPKDVSAYTRGAVAMANSGPNTGGSQWFVWMGPDPLPGPNYTRFGQVTDGLETTVATIEKSGSKTGAPTDPTKITSVTITET